MTSAPQTLKDLVDALDKLADHKVNGGRVINCAVRSLPALRELLSQEPVLKARWNGEGEPYFVIRGKDKFAVEAIRAWLVAAREYDEAETARSGFISDSLRACIKSASNVLQ